MTVKNHGERQKKHGNNRINCKSHLTKHSFYKGYGRTNQENGKCDSYNRSETSEFRKQKAHENDKINKPSYEKQSKYRNYAP